MSPAGHRMLSVRSEETRRVSGRPVRSEREPFRDAEICMIAVSFGLLLLTCVDAPPVRNLAVIAWLVSFAVLAVWNSGAALGLYITAVALYSNLFFSGTFSLFERPDHPALLILLGTLIFLRSRESATWSIDWITISIVAFLGYGVVNGFLTGTFSGRNVGQFARTFAIPMVMFLAIRNGRSRPKDLWSFFIVMFILAFYSALVSVMWQFPDLKRLIFPFWITDPAVSKWADSIRSGGILIQPAWNGLLLSLTFCMVYLAYHRWVLGQGRVLLLMLGGAILVAIYLTYTRGVYLAALAAVVGLLWMKTGMDRRVTVRRFALVILAVMGLALAFTTRPSTLEGRIGKESTAVWRLEIWRVALQMIPSRPLFGFGLRGYGEHAYRYLEESDVLSRGSIEKRQPAVHNTFLNIMVELGLVGFSLYAILHILIFLRAARRAGERWGRQGVMWVLIFMGSFYIAAQFAVAQEPATTAMFYGTLGLLAALPVLRGSHGHEARAQARARTAMITPAWPRDP